jgi:hypothetical protein
LWSVVCSGFRVATIKGWQNTTQKT